LRKPNTTIELFLGDRGSQILDLGGVLSHKHNHRRFRNPTDPRIADELWVQGKQAARFFWISAGRGLPIDQAGYSVRFTDRIQVANKFAAGRQDPTPLGLKALLRFMNGDAIVLSKSFQQKMWGLRVSALAW